MILVTKVAQYDMKLNVNKTSYIFFFLYQFWNVWLIALAAAGIKIWCFSNISITFFIC